MPRNNVPSLDIEDGMLVSAALQFVYKTYFYNSKVVEFVLQLNSLSEEMRFVLRRHLRNMLPRNGHRVHRINVEGADIAFVVSERNDMSFVFERVPYDEDEIDGAGSPGVSKARPRIRTSHNRSTNAVSA